MAVDRHLPIVKNLVCPDEAATEALAQALARAPGVAQAFLALHGDLGAGKTTLVRHLLRALGVQGRIKSPTYAVVEPHEAHRPDGSALPVFHFDFYRFSDPREWEDAGFRDIFAGPGLKLAEWPEQAAAYLPTADLDVTLQVQDEQRLVILRANTAVGADLLQGLSA
jgi:tRNA threonylcarbamoyladenosine biosynthesis protein TsaE